MEIEIIKKLYDIAGKPYPPNIDDYGKRGTNGDNKNNNQTGACPNGVEEIFGNLFKTKE